MKLPSIILALCAPLFFALSAKAQTPTPKAAVVRYDKTDRPGLTIEFPAASNIVETALRNHLSKAGFSKRNSRKGFDTYKAQNWDEISGKQVDVYTSVTGNKNTSMVSLLVSKGYDNFVTAENDPDMFGKMQTFMSSLQDDIVQEQLKVDIAAQQDLLKNAERDLSKEQDNTKSLQKQKEEIEKKISGSNDKQNEITKVIGVIKGKIQEMQSRLK